LFVAFAVGVIFFTGAVNAVGNVSDIYIDYARTQGASRFDVYRTVILPAMFPELRSSILLGLGMAWTSVVAAEFLGAQTGLGQIIVSAQYFGYVDRMFVVALFLLLYASITYALFERASRRLTEWMPREHNARGAP
jgi:sulfonate transport system permease protein